MELRVNGVKIEMKQPYLLVFVILFVNLVGCSSIKIYEMPLPTQDISSQVPDGMTRVIFFNATSPSRIGHGQLAIEIDGKGGPVIERGEYFQMFLLPGKHTVKLEQIDPVSFTDTYALDIGATDTYIRVIRELAVNRLSVVSELPGSFMIDYVPITP